MKWIVESFITTSGRKYMVLDVEDRKVVARNILSEQEANLIASAPALLSAARSAFGTLSGLRNGGHKITSGELDGNIAKLQEAFAKSRGEA